MSDATSNHQSDDPLISIGVLADRVGLSAAAVRKYENEGLILVHRSASGHRLFSHEDISRVRNIQYMIQDLGLNIEGIRRMQALLPCWDLFDCDAESCKKCRAYEDGTRPCWAIKGLDCASQGNQCRRCVGYRFGSLYTQDIKRLLHERDDNQDTCAAIESLMQRKRESRDKES